MGLIENPKTYTGRDLETIFFRPMLTGQNAEQLGIRVLYNMPVPTTIQLWSPSDNILQPYNVGWNGGCASNKHQKTIELSRIKAELGFGAADYFSQVYELITNRSDVNLDDLTGTELEQAETEMFRAAIAESLRVTMWIGDTTANKHNMFDGFITKLMKYDGCTHVDFTNYDVDGESSIQIFQKLWAESPALLKSMKGDGNLVLLVSSDVYDAYDQYLDAHGSDAAYTDLTTGRRELSYHGIKLIDIGVSHLLHETNIEGPICILTDRRNLVLAVNTADYPGSEVRMWYNPDDMENRQRAIFMAGCEILDETLVSVGKFRA